jgi:hypothetical protein
MQSTGRFSFVALDIWLLFLSQRGARVFENNEFIIYVLDVRDRVTYWHCGNTFGGVRQR